LTEFGSGQELVQSENWHSLRRELLHCVLAATQVASLWL
jgi:hypothetical protein